MSLGQADTRLEDLSFRAEMAGAALGCYFSSSAEYEAALIAERRKAGAYRKPLWLRMTPWAVTTAAALIVALPL